MFLKRQLFRIDINFNVIIIIMTHMNAKKSLRTLYNHLKEDAHEFKNVEKPINHLLFRSWNLNVLFVTKNYLRNRRKNSYQHFNVWWLVLSIYLYTRAFNWCRYSPNDPGYPVAIVTDFAAMCYLFFVNNHTTHFLF